ncbi:MULTISPECIES: type II toxin-antitoxin system PemK/MazF family toxin [unclassified Cyanobium]|uniref:type II toxin-antitoxin system PemK/MazF family toxin n=1 Tax=unclassified Cyanobium TaxID=2627006 RepID=UPI0020CE5EB9|nr:MULTISPECIES: type II toxin-antitoxin system PemK/MazF family toxin [unclassified Cyanobium]MCP9860795.1 type II toxin-antitoxin system PemK/MazF family toxin [Cyanobium sp. Cruz-8H5]MCP9868007.1 type II toxin-antitoxin system PemK/MazF family toxin [Cyanobium sp. Cruz-8D1]
MAERGRLYHWPRNCSFGDSKRRPVVVLAPEAATSRSRRWVVLPLSSDGRLEGQPLAYPLDPTPSNGLQQRSYVMAWLPTTVAADQLEGPLGRLEFEQLAAVLKRLTEALDLQLLEPWQDGP